MKEEIKYYTPETQEEVINWIMSEGYLPIKGEVETKGMSNFKLSFGEDFKDNLYNLVEFINSQNKTEFNNKTVEQSIALELYEIPYLNQQDIEELGFTKDKKKSSKFDFILGTKYTLDHYNLYLSDNTKRTIITSNDLTRAYEYGVGPKEYTLFNGKIKNKSRLKEVLQMIGVL